MAIAMILSLILSSCSADIKEKVEVKPHNELDPQIEEYIKSEFSKSHLPGMSLEIVNDKGILFEGNYGEAVSGDQPFILGSLSKSFTAVSIMQLEEKGLLSVDDSAAKYLPGYNVSSKTTIRQLLNQTSGLKTSATMEKYKTYDEQKPFIYSNQNFNLLGLIVEQVSGMPYNDYIQKNIFGPLEMNHSYSDYAKASKDNLIPGTRNYFGFYFHSQMPYPENMTSGWMTVSAAYIISTANDMGKYLQWYMNDSHPEVLSVQNRSRMFDESIKAAPDYEYGFGWGIYDCDGRKMYMHGGNVENYTTYMIIIPDMKTAVVALTNSCDIFVADSFTVSIPTNTALKIMSSDTEDIAQNQYWKLHILYDILMLVTVILCVLPVIRYSKWRKNKHNIIHSCIFTAAVHILTPSLMLTITGIALDRPLYVIRRFVPDMFIIICVCTVCLYGIGAAKIISLVKQISLKHRNKTNQ